MQWIAPTAKEANFVSSVLKRLTCGGDLVGADIKGWAKND